MESPILSYLRGVHTDLSRLRDGIPYLIGPSDTAIDPDDFGIALATVDGYVYEVGTTSKQFSLQSLSKPLSYGLALTELGSEAVDAKVDVEPSGDPFHEFSLSESTGRPANAMINAGALAVSSLIKGSGGRSAIKRIEDHYSLYAGRQLRSNGRVYRAERAHSDRNHGLSYLLSSAGVIDGDPTRALETYLRQCSVQVTCRDLAVMAATLANGGTNPVTGVEALTLDAVERVLSVMLTSGMYDDAGDWVVRVGMPAKSGVGGGIIAVLPGQAGLAVFSPPLDQHGNSVRGVAACRRISHDMEMHFVRSARVGQSAIRSNESVDREPSSVRRTEEAVATLAEHGHRARVVSLAGDLYFAGTESVMRELSGLDDEVESVVVDVSGVDEASHLATEMFTRVRERFETEGRRIMLVDPDHVLEAVFPADDAARFESTDEAIARCEEALLDRYGAPGSSPEEVPVIASPALSMLDPADIRAIASLMDRRTFTDGEIVRRVGQRFGGVFFILSGSIDIIGSDLDGNRVKVSTLSAGMTFGDLALGDDDRQETTAKADGPVELMVLGADAIEALETSDPRLAVQLWRALARDAYFRMDVSGSAQTPRSRD